MATSKRARCAVIVATTIAASIAAADTLAPPGTTLVSAPSSQPTSAPWQVSLSGTLRVTALDGAAARFSTAAEAYGWVDSSAGAALGTSLEVSYLRTPIADLGVIARAHRVSYDSGVRSGDTTTVRLIEAAAMARLHWARGRAFLPEPRFDVGVASERWSLHGTTESAARPFVRLGIDWRLGTRRAGVNVAIGYTVMDVDPTDGPRPPLGGLDLGLGPYVRF
jgi:hypothetical protein